MKVACIIVARNEAPNIGQTLKALTSQTVKVDPIVVVDDGSIDETTLIAERYGCKVILLSQHRERLEIILEELGSEGTDWTRERIVRGFLNWCEEGKVNQIVTQGVWHPLSLAFPPSTSSLLTSC